MTRTQWVLIALGVLLVTLVFPLVPILFWVALAVAAWYIKGIPEKKLPYAAFFATHQPTFYNWLSGFLSSWRSIPMFAFFALIGLSLIVWGGLTLRVVPLPSYGASVDVRNSNGDWVGGISTTSNASDCIDNLADGQYAISETNMSGWVSSTPDVVTATLKSGSVVLVEFGDTNLTASTQMISRTIVSTQIVSNTQIPVLNSICALIWNDLNANGIRDPGEPLLYSHPPWWMSFDFWLHIAGILFLFLNTFAFYQAKYMAWDIKLWQAEPAARTLLGPEYDTLTKEKKAELHRHIADVEVGINKGTWVVANAKKELLNVPADTFAKFGGPGVLIVQEGHAVVLERSGRISRIVGAGFCQLAPYERPHMVVYLPTRAEHFTVYDVLTRDKMVIQSVELLVFHRADRGDKSSYSGSYRFDRKVILEQIWSPKGDDWRDGVKGVSDSATRDVIAQYDFEDLVSISGDNRRKFLNDLVGRINIITKEFMGVEVIAANLGEIKISDEAKKALEEKGLVEVRRKTKVIQAEGEKEARSTVGDGEREYLRKQGEGRALAAREEGLAKAEGESERVREMLLALNQLPIDDKSKLELLKTMFQGDQYRDAMRMWSSMGRSRGSAGPAAGSGDGSVPPPSEGTRTE